MVWQNPMPGTGKDWRLGEQGLGEQGLGEQGYSMVSLPLRRPLLLGLSTCRPPKSLGSTLNVLNPPCGGGAQVGRLLTQP